MLRISYEPVHTRHIEDDPPEIANLLGLPPGYRFMKACDYLDVWFGPKLLEVND